MKIDNALRELNVDEIRHVDGGAIFLVPLWIGFKAGLAAGGYGSAKVLITTAGAGAVAGATAALTN